MKKQMKLTAILASVSLLCSSAPLMQSSALYYWGDEKTEVFEQNMQLLDDKGMLAVTDVDSEIYYQHISREFNDVLTDADTGETQTIHKKIENDNLYQIIPRTAVLRYVLNDASDSEQAAEIAAKYFPDYEPSLYWTDQLTYDLFVGDIRERTDEKADQFMQELAQAGLISEFYTWGETANYRELEYGFVYGDEISHYVLTYRPPFREMLYDWEQLGFNQAKVEQYLQENNIDCSVKRIVLEDEYYTYDHENSNMVYYQVVPNGEMSFADQFALGADLYEKFGYRISVSCLEDASMAAVGRNALAVDGDVTLDSKLSIADAVLLSRYVNEDAVTITPQGLSNAELNSDNQLTMDDVNLILRKIARLD